MNNSVLTVNIIEARGLSPSSSGYKAFLSTENQRIYTEVSIPKQGDPVWKEVVTFDIQTGKEPLYVQIIDGEGKNSMGQSEVPLDFLND
jgi:hypothetical protein